MSSWEATLPKPPQPYNRQGFSEQIRIKVTPQDSDLLGQLIEIGWLPGAKGKADLHRYALGLLFQQIATDPLIAPGVAKTAQALVLHEQYEAKKIREATDTETLDLFKKWRIECDTQDKVDELMAWAKQAIDTIHDPYIRETFESEVRRWQK